MFGWLAALVRGLWGFSRASWIDVGHGLRPGSAASALFLFMFLVFCLAGGLLILLGFDLDDVDAWLNRHQNWFELLGNVAFKLLWGFILLVSALVVASVVWFRVGALARWARGVPSHRHAAGEPPPTGGAKEGEDYRPGWGMLLAAMAFGYFAWIGLVT